MRKQVKITLKDWLNEKTSAVQKINTLMLRKHLIKMSESVKENTNQSKEILFSIFKKATLNLFGTQLKRFQSIPTTKLTKFLGKLPSTMKLLQTSSLY